ncbi:Oidioi.mRNA.OKI2018_I69.PAR.g8615.t1.cds [Oikopleura dioica]|uniref:Sulfotransferase n=1 Tax=Oikopleura dioica TaxID=34765 RepID=A0ABN7RGR7_OIKDI|nr:Oidioi.mRNA.OKI2018_I69.PAR.g8615.t1.cds [Oikopleura dioica]
MTEITSKIKILIVVPILLLALATFRDYEEELMINQLEEGKYQPQETGIEKEILEQECSERKVRLGKKGEFEIVPLLSYPGSGNTWTRILLEDATGIYTGSIYSDGSLARGGFKGEGTNPLSGMTMIVKSHFPSNEEVMDRAKALIFVVRNPYDAIIAEFKRRRGHGHTSVVEEDIFKSKPWFENAPRWLQGWGNLARNVTEIARSRNLPLHVYSFERLKENATYEMEKVLNFLDDGIGWTPDDREMRIKCLSELQKAAVSFKREKVPPSFEYYTKEMIEIGDKTIRDVHEVLLEAGFDVFDIEEYFRS